MSKRTLEDLKNAFSQKTSGDNAEWKKFFPFWKMDDNSTTVVRFLPDLDEDNPKGFLVENLTHELVVNGEKKKVPCLTMYGEECPICALARKYYDEGNEDMGKKYYKKKSYIGQILVIEAPFEHDDEPLVKLIEFGPKIFKRIQAAFQSGDLDSPPYELVGGYNFRIVKTKDGKFADYGNSSFSPKSTNVSDEVIAALELYNLGDYRTKPMTREILEAMLVSDRTGASFKDEKEDHKEEPKASTPAEEPKSEKQESATPPAEEPKVEASSKAREVLEKLRAKKAAAAA